MSATIGMRRTSFPSDSAICPSSRSDPRAGLGGRLDARRVPPEPVARNGARAGQYVRVSGVLVGAVQSIRRYAVKSMLGEEIGAASVMKRGVVGDRVYALIDDETGKVVSVKRPRRWGRIFELAAVTGTSG